MEDVWSIDSPTSNTSLILSRGIKMSGLAVTVHPGQQPPVGVVILTQLKMANHQTMGDTEESPQLCWQPGRLLGPNDTARALVSHNPTFIPPSDMDPNLLSATCRSHMEAYRRPTGAGVGWGDFDRYHEWQLFGRQAKRSMVEEKQWRWSNDPNVAFNSERARGVFYVPTDSGDFEPFKRIDDLTTLWEQVNRPKVGPALRSSGHSRGGPQPRRPAGGFHGW